ncbi:MAG TPA: NPCBM/NEW2 domain-containing protein [Phycisphaerae bacterium]|nr:NPCBM/NEW2 domain-containing protein [Phycisphaerae bacterium]
MVACVVAFLAAMVWGQAPASAPASAGVTMVSGESFQGRLTAVDGSSARFLTPDGARTVPIRDLWTVQVRPGVDVLASGGAVIALRAPAGGMMAVRKLLVTDGRITGENDLLGGFRMDVSMAEAIYLPPAGKPPSLCRDRHVELALPAARHDFLVAADSKGNWVPVPGALKGIAAGKVTFDVQGQDRTIDLADVRIIQLARLAATAPVWAGGELAGVDGSRVPFASLTLAGGKLSVSGPALEARAASAASIAAIRFGSDRVAYLSDLPAAKVVEAGTFEAAFPFRRDRAAAGGPIRLGGKTYARGLGMHSRCEVTYDLGGRYAVLAAVAGIDQAGGGRGNATVHILGDGKDRIEPLTLAGGDKPIPIRCDVAGVKTLTIRVDFGPDKVDVGDHVSLGDARLIKP